MNGIESLTSIEEYLPTFSTETKAIGKAAALFFGLVATFKAIEYFTGKTATDIKGFEPVESDDSYTDLTPFKNEEPTVEKIAKNAEETLINRAGEWTGEGTEGFFLDAEGNEHYFHDRQPG